MDPIEEPEPKPLLDFGFIPDENNEIPNKNTEIENFIKNYQKNSTITNDFGKNNKNINNLNDDLCTNINNDNMYARQGYVVQT